MATHDVTILVPLYNAIDHTVQCVDSLLASDAAGCRIILADDGSRVDQHAVLKERYRAADGIEIVSHMRNRGYTRNVRLVWDTIETPYVALLNSDTVVPERWLGPLHSVLEQHRYLAAVGPLSNAGSHQSIPDVRDPAGGFSSNANLGADATGREALAAFLAGRFAGLVIDLPVLNGFCTLFRRRAVDAVGGFDDETFREGYGEENDLCVRLSRRGWRLGCVPGVFVHHAKSRSFGVERRDRLAKSAVQSLGKKFHATLTRELDQLLRASVELAAVRQCCAFLQDAPAVPVSRATAKAGVRELPAQAGRLHLLTVKGPATLLINDGEFHLTHEASFPEPMFALSGAQLRVSLPAESEISFIGERAVATVLGALMLLSCSRPVYVDEWEPDSEFDPGLGADDGHLPFAMLYAAPETPWQEPAAAKAPLTALFEKENA